MEVTIEQGSTCGFASVRIDTTPSADPIRQHTWKICESIGSAGEDCWEQTKLGPPERSIDVPYSFESCRTYSVSLKWFHTSPSCEGHEEETTKTMPGADPPASLEAWWTGDQTKLNRVSSLHHGQWVAEDLTPLLFGSYAEGKVGKAFDFENSTAYLEVPHNNRLDPGAGDYSIDAWVYNAPGVANTRQPIFYKIACGRTVNGSVESDCDTTSGINLGYGFEMFNDGGFLTLQLINGRFTTLSALNSVSQPLDLSNEPFGWRFVAVTVERGVPNGVHFYVDGVDIGCAQNCTMNEFNFTTTPARIGADESGTPPGDPYRTHLGRIDELEFFRAALTPEEVMGIFEAGKCGKCRRGYEVIVPERIGVCPLTPRVERTIKVCNRTDEGQLMVTRSDPTPGIEQGYLPGVCDSFDFLGPNDIIFRPGNLTSAAYPVDGEHCETVVVDLDANRISFPGDTACYGIDAKPAYEEGGAYQVGVIYGLDCSGGVDVHADEYSLSSLVVEDGGMTPTWSLRNTGSSPVDVRIRLAATPIGREHGPVGVSIGALPEGVPEEWTFSMTQSELSFITSPVSVLEYRPRDMYRFTLSVDFGNDGIYELSDDQLMEPVLRSNACPDDFDYDGSGFVDQNDQELIQAALGSSDLRFDHNNDSQVSAVDFAIFASCLSPQSGGPPVGSSPLVGPIPDRLDLDNDTIPDASDNCPQAFNPLQEDVDADLIGDACEVVLGDEQDWSRVANPSNDPDFLTGYGTVEYEFDIGKVEVTNTQYTAFLNAVAADDTYGLFDIAMQNNINDWGGIDRFGSSGNYTYSTKPGFEALPVNNVTFWDAVRYVNWLANGKPTGSQDASTTEDGSYLLTATAIANNTVTRKPGATIVIPTEDEWYKAAYYEDEANYYFIYPTKSFGLPVCTEPGLGSNVANCAMAAMGPTDVGGYPEAESPYRTHDQGGNVAEWTESIFGDRRVARGGSFLESAYLLEIGHADLPLPADSFDHLGFRIAEADPGVCPVPEPGFLASLAPGVLLLCALAKLRKDRRLASSR